MVNMNPPLPWRPNQPCPTSWCALISPKLALSGKSWREETILENQISYGTARISQTTAGLRAICSALFFTSFWTLFTPTSWVIWLIWFLVWKVILDSIHSSYVFLLNALGSLSKVTDQTLTFFWCISTHFSSCSSDITSSKKVSFGYTQFILLILVYFIPFPWCLFLIQLILGRERGPPGSMK